MANEKTEKEIESSEDAGKGSSWMQFLKTHKYELLASPIAVIAVILLFKLSFFLHMEYLTMDMRFKVRTGGDEPADKRQVILAIDDQSIEEFGWWPWKRYRHGDLLQLLTLAPPKVITYDLFFSESDDEENDQNFADGMSMHDYVITGIYGTDDEALEASGKKNPSKETHGLTRPIRNIVGDKMKILGQERSHFPIELFRQNSYFGFVNVDPSRIDGIRRRLPFVFRTGIENDVYPSLSLQTLMRYWDLVVEDVEVVLGAHVKLTFPETGEIKYIPINDKGEFYVNYRAQHKFQGIPYSFLTRILHEIYLGIEAKQEELAGMEQTIALKMDELYERETGATEKDKKKIAKEMDALSIEFEKVIDLQDKLVENPLSVIPYPEKIDDFILPKVKDSILLAGQTASGLTDLGPTPLQGKAPLVLVHANVINNILKEDYLKVIPVWPIFCGTLMLMWVSLFVLKDRAVIISIGIPACVIAVYVCVAIAIFASNSIQLPFLQPILAYAGVHFGAFYIHWKKEAAQKDRIKGMFGTYLSPELVHTMVESGDEPQLGGVNMEITAFFSDVQGFSGFSEKLEPHQLVDLMNEYLTAMTKILMDSGCYVDKYIGDAIVGIYNAPVELKNHALIGCIASMHQHKRLAELRDKWKSEGDKWPPIVSVMQARLGMNTGHATVGNMGSEDRFNYTMMGDTVNLAARCESGAKAYGVYSMITGETKDAACAAGDDCVFRFLDKIIVKGRSAPAEMYEIVCLKEDLSAEIEKCLEVYNGAVAHYLKQDWDKAYESFEAASKLEPNRPELNDQAPTTPSNVMMQRTLDMKKSPPGADWDGVYVMTTK